jgi:hypothetical protein
MKSRIKKLTINTIVTVIFANLFMFACMLLAVIGDLVTWFDQFIRIRIYTIDFKINGHCETFSFTVAVILAFILTAIVMNLLITLFNNIMNKRNSK